ncbi:MAG: glycosyltransferase family 4 protein [Chloroflexota bacterium]
MTNRPLRVCYFGTYRANYSRNQILIAGLRQAGVEVVECHAPLWRGIEDRVQAASGGWRRPGFLWRVLRTYWRLLRAYARVGDFDVMVLGYPGQLDVFLARLLTWQRRKPLVLDVFMSIYLIAAERGLVAKSPFTGRWIGRLERWACLLPERLIIDTAAYRDWFVETYHLAPERFRLVPTGADDRIFTPVPAQERGPGFCVMQYSGYLPGTGVDVILEAASRLQDEPDIHFHLLGDGQLKPQAVAQAQRLGLKNVTFFGWVDKHELPLRAAAADVCLGVFARAEQSERTVVNKVYEALAMAKPLITGDSPTVREHLVDGEEVLLVPREDPDALARTILRLWNDPALARSLAERGHGRYLAEYAIASLGEKLRRHLRELLVERKQV